MLAVLPFIVSGALGPGRPWGHITCPEWDWHMQQRQRFMSRNKKRGWAWQHQSGFLQSCGKPRAVLPQRNTVAVSPFNSDAEYPVAPLSSARVDWEWAWGCFCHPDEICSSDSLTNPWQEEDKLVKGSFSVPKWNYSSKLLFLSTASMETHRKGDGCHWCLP